MNYRGTEAQRGTTGRGKVRREVVERVAVGVMGVGVCMVAQPWVGVLFRWGFLVTLGGIVMVNVAGQMKGGAK